MKKRTLLSFSALLLILACNSTDTGAGLFDGTTADGWSSVGDAKVSIRADETGDKALSVSGSNAEGAAFSFKLNAGDASGSTGVTFRIRASGAVRFSVTSKGVVPVDSGGSCTSNCWDLHGKELQVGTTWQVVTLSWAELQQASGSNAVALIADQITYLNWEAQGSGAYDIWIDDLDFVYDTINNPSTGSGGSGTGGSPATGGSDTGSSTGGTDTGTGGTVNESTNRLGKFVDSLMFIQGFTGRNPIYKYSKLLAAVDQFPEFASCCSDTEKKREIAAFLAHAQHEADNLAATDEYGTHDPGKYCRPGDSWPCVAGKSYHGRGALQITWNYNYGMAEEYFASKGMNYDLRARPEQVSTDEDLLWLTAMWFWMEGEPGTQSAHDLLKTGGYGATIRKINGQLECDGAAPDKVQKRIEYFQAWCAKLGVDPGTNLGC